MTVMEELKRRSVFRVGAAYLVTAWLLLQVSELVLDSFAAPAWVMQVLLLATAIGFPAVLLLAWAFELTPEGLKRDRDVDHSTSYSHTVGRKLDFAIIGVLVLAVAYFVTDKWLLSDGQSPGDSAVAAREQSIAVLPFANLSDDQENEFFADGLAEELLNLLAQVDGLRVTARTSTFFYKDKNPSIAEVAETLDVDTILEGSVRRSGDTIRVVVQLIAADSNAHLWSERYDRPMGELFSVQDDIANRVITELLPHLQATDTPAIASDTTNITPAVFERFLLARQNYHVGSTESLALARDGFLAVTISAPNYAPAWAWLARCWIDSGGRGPVEIAGARRAAEEAIRKALALDPDQPMAFVARGDILYEQDQFDEALLNYDRAITSNPDLVDAHIARQDVLIRLGQTDAAIESLQQASVIDPLHTDVLENLAHLLNLQGQRREALESVATLWLVNPVAAANLEAHLYSDSGQYAHALYLAEEFGSASAGVLAYWSVMLGLHEEPVIQQTAYRPVSLAVQGRRDEALAALATVKQEEDNAQFRADMEFMTMVVLEEYETAKDLLWERWASQDSDNPAPDLQMPSLIVLAGLMRKLDDTERISPVIQAMFEQVSSLSQLHAGAYHFLHGNYALVNGDVEEATRHFDILATSGDAGMGMYGTALPVAWLFEQDPQLASVYERFVDNQNRQTDALNRFRSESLTLEQIREDYIAAAADRSPVDR